MPQLNSTEQEVLDNMLLRRPDLGSCVEGLLALHARLVTCYESGGTLYTCGNGGSNADAMHIAGELLKSFERKRPLPPGLRVLLEADPYGKEIAGNLEAGLRAYALGFSGALKTAVENDIPVEGIAFAQELNSLVRPGDVLLGISTSGNAKNCLYAMAVAKAHAATAVSLTGPGGGKMAAYADLAILAPGGSTKEIQEAHIVLWHTMCCLIESHYFPEMR